jgi:hypothetical protein
MYAIKKWTSLQKHPSQFTTKLSLDHQLQGVFYKSFDAGRELLLKGSVVDLLVKIACFVKRKKIRAESSCSELVRTRRSIVLILPPFSKHSLMMVINTSLE